MCIFPGCCFLSHVSDKHDRGAVSSELRSSTAVTGSYCYKTWEHFLYLVFLSTFLGVLVSVWNCLLKAALDCSNLLFVRAPVLHWEQSSPISWCLEELEGAHCVSLDLCCLMKLRTFHRKLSRVKIRNDYFRCRDRALFTASNYYSVG